MKNNALDTKVAGLFGEVRDRFSQAASWYPDSGIKALFNRSVAAIDGIAAKPGDFSTPGSAKATAARDTCLFIAFMEDEAEQTRDREVMNDFAKMRPKLKEIETLLGR